ncbi:MULTISPECIES: cytochrome P450 [unclassified Burkholderia]|uniref:cytochrome P450 n=1 Tax=unclassified Burkholderia TaxID=2613784 RepID=UPI002AB22493|nr:MULTISPECIES: cytochrome P450 [unclassified Burkholderia]
MNALYTNASCDGVQTHDKQHAGEQILLPWRDKAFRANPYPWYEVLREKAPVYRDPLSENTYVISHYYDVLTFGKHPSLTTKAPSWVPRGPWSLFKDSMIVVDPPEHAAMRRKSNKWFTPKKAEEWVEATSAEVIDVIDRLGPSGMIEAYRNLALIPAHYAMCKALGIPNDGFDTAAAWMHDAMLALGSVVSEEEEERCYAAFAYLTDRVNHYIRLRRESPDEGMVSSWIDSVVKGEMTERQLFEGLLLFWATATPNAAYLITGGLEMFARHPEVFDMWRNQPEKRHAIFNEIARLYTAEVSFTRFTTEELNIRGVKIPPGMMIRFMISAANRDPEAFPNPDKFDVERSVDGKVNLTFGTGAHSCPGMLLARAEAHAVYNALAARVKRIDLGGEPIYDHDDRNGVYDRLPLRLVV